MQALQSCGPPVSSNPYPDTQEEKAGTAKETNLLALNPKKKIPFALTEKIELSHNTRLFRFALQSPRHRLGLPIGQHMFFYCKVAWT